MESDDEFAYERGDDSGDVSGDDSDSDRGGLRQSEGKARHEHTNEYQGGATHESSAVDAVDDAVTSPGFGGAGGREHAHASSNIGHDYVARDGSGLAQPSGIATSAAPSLVSLTRGLPPRSPVLHAQRQRPHHRQESAAHDDVVDDVEP
jgi:hypothetical protein